MHTSVPFRARLEQMSMTARTNGAKAATFEVNYIGFTVAERTAFQYAVDIWASLLTSDVTIRISVAMSNNMGDGTLASTGWGGLNANFDNAQKINTWYVVPLAEKIAGHDLNEIDEIDIGMNFNGEIDNWYLGTDAATPTGEFDFVSISLHEIAHGLGIFSHTFENNDIGSYGNNVNGVPLIYTQMLETGAGENLVATFDNNSEELGTALTGNSLFFNSFSFDVSDLPRIEAPSTFNPGSSIAHLRENTYLAGNINSLMTPQLGLAEAIHEPGLALDMLFDMGWISMDIDHERLKDTEDLASPIAVTAVITGDNALAADGANLHYTTSDFTNEVVVNMTPTANPEEYSADIPAPGADATISYYIEVDDDAGRKFLNPGEAPEFFHLFVVAPDTIDPVILHEPLNFVFTFDPTANIVATVLDNIGVGPLEMTYRKNGGTESTIEIPLVNQDNDGVYAGEYALAWDLNTLGVVKGDIVEYKLSVSDVSVAANSTIHPGFGFNQIQVDELKPAVEFYSNDFNATTDDFIGVGFTIGTESGFSNGSIQSDHPYRNDRGVEPEDTLILQYLLKSPIILSAGNPSLTFDEVVLVEPGEPGTKFGDDEFWDYVIVEGSDDLGITWHPLVDGYDSRAQSTWLSQWNSDLVVTDDVPDSEAPGNEGLYKPRAINMLAATPFKGGDEILIRFRLFADQLAVGWGWAIDNVKIQIDDTPPEIAHIAPDYLNVDDTALTLIAKVTDNAILDSVTFEVNLDGVIQLIGMDQPVDIYELNLSFNPVTTSSILKYRIIAVDSATNPNTTILPESGFFEIPVAELGEVKTVYINDFNTPSTDFIGTNFTIAQPSGFNDDAIQSLHPYSNAPIGTSTMSYLLKYPIKLNDGRAWFQYDEVALVDPVGDRVLVEASKDNGSTWFEIVSPYSATDDTDWFGVYSVKDADGNSIGIGSAQLMRTRLVDLLLSPDLVGGDEILIRFTMRVDAGVTGWGWTIDNVEIQAPTTAIEETVFKQIQVYPNPLSNGLLHIRGEVMNFEEPHLQIVDLMGKQIYTKDLQVISGRFDEQVDLHQISPGFYLVKISQGDSQFATRIIIK